VFGPPQESALSGTTLPRLVLGDVNGDGFADLVIGHAAGAPGLRLGDGEGHFDAEVSLDVAASGDCVALADLNADGTLDLLVAQTSPEWLSVAMGTGGGSFASPAIEDLGDINDEIQELSLDVADGDGDGDLDVLVLAPAPPAYPKSGKAYLFRNTDGLGSLGLVTVHSVHPQAAWVCGVIDTQIADLNGDHRPDLVSVFDCDIGTPSCQTYAFICASDATTVSMVFTWTQVDVRLHDAVDIDGDGTQDLVTRGAGAPTGPAADEIQVFLGVGDGDFSAGPISHLPTPDSVLAPGLADVDGDGALDLVGLEQWPPELWVMRGLGDGSFAPPSPHVTLSTWLAASRPYGFTDLEGDGRTDVVVAMGHDSPWPSTASSFNRTYATGGPLLDLGHQLEGASWPIQIAQGSFTTGQPFAFTLSGAPASGSAYFIAGTAQLDAPFKGGTMVPLPFLITGPWPASPSGAVSIAGLWPAAPSGLGLVLQLWIPDAAGPVGFAASSGVQLTLP
jgi:hypothetical protein